MSIDISSEVEADAEQANRLRRLNQVIEPLLLQRSQTATGLWQAWHDEKGRTLLTLTISDPWGSAVADFDPHELELEDQFENRLKNLIGEMINPAPGRGDRERIDVRDTFTTTERLEHLRRRLECLPDLDTLGLRMRNQVRFLPNHPHGYLLTDFVVEVNAHRAEEVRTVLEATGFHVRREMPVLQKPGTRDAVKRLVQSHLAAEEAVPQFAVCFRTDDRHDIHLLEVAEDVAELGDGALAGVGFEPTNAIPGARTLIVYLVHPSDLRAAWRYCPDHPLFRDLRHGACDFIYPDDGGEVFARAFPEFWEGGENAMAES